MKSTILTLSAVVVLFSTSCRKSGCTDRDASNYSESAKKDDGSCTYRAQLIVWWKQDVAQNLINDQTTSLKLYANGVLGATSMANVFYPSIPHCDQQSQACLWYNFDLGKNKSQLINYEVRAQDDWLYWTNTTTLSAGCNTIELLW